MHTHKKTDIYDVVVSNIGIIRCKGDAHKTFQDYVDQSRRGIGRAAGESVTLMRNNEPIKEYVGTLTLPE